MIAYVSVGGDQDNAILLSGVMAAAAAAAAEQRTSEEEKEESNGHRHKGNVKVVPMTVRITIFTIAITIIMSTILAAAALRYLGFESRLQVLGFRYQGAG